MFATDNARLFRSVLAVHIDDPDIELEVTANPVSFRCVYVIGCPIDEERVDRTVRAYQRGETLSITVSAAERSDRLWADLTREAKQAATPLPDDLERASAIQFQRA